MTSGIEAATFPVRYALIEYATNKNFCNIYEALNIERLLWEVITYDRERRVHLERAVCYLPISRCKLLAHQVLNGQAQRAEWKTEVFGGSERDGQIESRVFRLEYDPGSEGRFVRFPFRLTITVGAGRRTTTGGIAPHGAPTTQVSMRFPEDDFVTICLEVRDYMAHHQEEIEAFRRRQQQERYSERQRGGSVLTLPFSLRRAGGGEYPAGTPLSALDRNALHWLATNARHQWLKQAAEELAVS